MTIIIYKIYNNGVIGKELIANTRQDYILTSFS